MALKDANIWKLGLFKGIGSLFSSPGRTIDCVLVSETGIVSLETLPLYTSYACHNVNRAAWLVIQKLAIRMGDRMVLPISEKSYIPLDPLGKLTKEERKQLTPLVDIADSAYDKAITKVDAENKTSENSKLLKTILYLGFILCSIIVIVIFLRKK